MNMMRINRFDGKPTRAKSYAKWKNFSPGRLSESREIFGSLKVVVDQRLFSDSGSCLRNTHCIVMFVNAYETSITWNANCDVKICWKSTFYFQDDSRRLLYSVYPASEEGKKVFFWSLPSTICSDERSLHVIVAQYDPRNTPRSSCNHPIPLALLACQFRYKSPAYVVHEVIQRLTFTAGSCDSVLKCSQRPLKNASLPNLPHFIKDITEKSKVTDIIMVVGLIYVHRLKKTLPPEARGDFDTPYKIFLSSILVASKYLSDHSLQNKTIADITNGLYTIKDVNTMERSFLGLLKYDLWVDRDEVKKFLEEHRDLALDVDWDV
ncbi:10032_t:CDS:2 [Acaulospora morrowiae]|uniref:10032_t:CDS:1 n=1 Tax=Acaulospora morrowiae TaxID=94023 RepID=A0A9N8VQG8_9GLOM|nr:10032_t:CDS:2 [Acaulospora morrowiae]